MALPRLRVKEWVLSLDKPMEELSNLHLATFYFEQPLVGSECRWLMSGRKCKMAFALLFDVALARASSYLSVGTLHWPVQRLSRVQGVKLSLVVQAAPVGSSLESVAEEKKRPAEDWEEVIY